jgi:hypothetical protein
MYSAFRVLAVRAIPADAAAEAIEPLIIGGQMA